MRRITFAFTLLACSSTQMTVPPDGGGPACALTIAPITSDGHADPSGAKAAKQARAGRIKDAKVIRQPIDARQRARLGDFLITNDKIAVVIEDKGLSDGYARFGGEILTIDRVADDGIMLGQSFYGETLAGIGGEMIHPESVGVFADGSDGKAAIVRVVGTFETVPFMAAFKKALPDVKFRAAFDYVLEPGAEVIRIRATILNASDEDRQFVALGGAMHGFFQSSRSALFTPEKGFGEPADASWVGWESEGTSFAWRAPGAKLKYNLNISGFQFYTGPEIDVAKCQIAENVPFAEIVVGANGIDSVREAVRRVDSMPAWREVTGIVKSAMGAPIEGAIVSVLANDGSLLTHAKTDSKGAYTLHAPSEVTSIVATVRGIPSSPSMLAATDVKADLVMGANGTITVHATEKGTSTKLPVRVQVIPEVAMAPTPETLGILDEENGRLHQDFAVTGDVTLPVPPGKHRVIVSRGYEWEMLDTTVTVTANTDTVVDAPLAHGVDSTGYMCADFHIHSFFSADSNDPVVHKVKGAIADGLDIPVSSEHEWVIDFQPVIKQLGLEKWAFGMPSEELTTFAWGHFGVVPLYPKPDIVNNGAIEWIGKQPPDMFANVAAQTEKPVLVINHPRSGGQLGGLGAYFDAANYDPATLKGNELWSDQFEAIECMNDSDFESNRNRVIKDWYSMLNAGKKRVCVGSSDSHHLRGSPVGYPRTCMYFGHDDTTKLTPEAVRDALRSGRSTVSGGIYMTVSGPNGEGPGQTAPSGSTFTVTASAPSWVDVDPNVEIIVDGATVGTMPMTPAVVNVGKKFTATLTIDRTNKKWIIFHVKGKNDLAPLHPGRKAFALSNPIFFQ